MLKALFLDLDDTLCDTSSANGQAMRLMAESLQAQYGDEFDGQGFSRAYVQCIYRNWSASQRADYTPIIEQQSESAFRVQLIRDLLAGQGVQSVTEVEAQSVQHKFDRDRLQAFGFYAGITEFLAEARKLFTLVVITNGPEYSQIPKVERSIWLRMSITSLLVGRSQSRSQPVRYSTKRLNLPAVRHTKLYTWVIV